MEVFVDMDGVLFDFVSASIAAHGIEGFTHDDATEWDYFESWGLDLDQFWQGIDRQGIAFWADLEPYPWFDELLSTVALYDHDFKICTAPSRSAHSPGGKAACLNRRVPQVGPDRYVFTAAKHLVARPGRVLIDDNPTNCNKWEAEGGAAICFPMPWSFDYAPLDAMAKIEYVAWNLEELAAECATRSL